MRKSDLREASRPHVWRSDDLSSDWILLFAGDDPLGRYWAPEEMSREEVAIIREFLIRLKGRKPMSQQQDVKTNDRVNMVFLAGTLKLDPRTFENGVRVLIDTGQKQAVQAGCYKASQIAEKLMRFKQGDFIRVIAILEPWGVKQADNTWKNGVSINITEIKNEPPLRDPPKQQNLPTDNDIPF